MPKEGNCISIPGTSQLFDYRIHWAEEALGGFKGTNVLELGPLEGHHSYMLQKAGAKTVTAIEANSRAFLKALRVMCKTTDQIVMWTHYYDENHISKNRKIAKNFSPLKNLQYKNFSYRRLPNSITMKGAYLLRCSPAYFHHYCGGRRYGWTGFCGGALPTSIWLTRESIISYLKFIGFTEIKISFESIDHPNGPSFNLCATRVPSRRPDADAAQFA